MPLGTPIKPLKPALPARRAATVRKPVLAGAGGPRTRRAAHLESGIIECTSVRLDNLPMKHRLAVPVRADISGDGGELDAGAGERIPDQEEHDGERYREDQCVAAERFGARGCQL